MSSSNDRSIRDRISQNDVTMMRSYLEADIAEWFSHNEIPFAYEAFVIPSVVGPSKEEWDSMVKAIKAIGRRNFNRYDNVTRGTRWEDVRPAEVMAIYEDIYDKHGLQNEKITIELRDSLRLFGKKMVLPDFAIYKDVDFKTAQEGFDYGSYDNIVEVSGLWGVGLPGEATESDWFDWYRVSAVAFKELVYKLLGLWEDVYWVIPNQPFIEGVTDGIPNALRDDPHYVIVNTTSANIQLDKLEDALGITADAIDNGLSPQIELVSYGRPSNNQMPTDFDIVEWEFDDVEFGMVNNHENAVIVGDYVVFHGELGEVYISDDVVQVRESQWRKTNMIMLREYVVDVLSELDDSGIINGLRKVS